MMFRYKSLVGLIMLCSLVSCSPQIVDYEWRRCDLAGWEACDIAEVMIDPDIPLELPDVVAFALEHNRDLVSQGFEWFAECHAVREQYLKQLPSINANGHWEQRNNLLISSSQSVTPQPPAPPSVSTNRQTKTWDVTPLFSILDFGVAYFQTFQEIHKAYALHYKHQRTRQTLILDVSKAYWRAVTGQLIMKEAAQLLADLQARRETLTQQLEDGVISRFVIQQRENRILEALVKYNVYVGEYHAALAELVSLMGLPPGCQITLADIDLCVSLPEIDIEGLELSALCLRPELYEQDAQENFDLEEIHLAILRMVPGAQLFGGDNYDGNTFLTFNHWITIGIRASYDLLAIPSRCSGVYKAQNRVEFDQEARLALAVGVISQVYLAHISLGDAYNQFSLAKEWSDVRYDLAKMTAQISELGQFGLDDVLDRRIDAMEAEIQAIKAYAATRMALEQLANSVGQPFLFYPEVDEEEATDCFLALQ